jgi:hypothetical protein
MTRLLVACRHPTLALLTSVLLIGCEEKPTPTTQPAPSPAAPAGTDWSTVVAADTTVTGDAMFRLARLVDVWHKGADQRVELTFRAGKVEDSSGHSAPITAEEWKGIVAHIAATSGRRTAVRTLPAREKSYGDGLGTARRHAYNLEAPSESTLVFTVVKPLNDDSTG